MKFTDFFLRIKVNSAPENNPIKIKDGLFVGSHLVAKVKASLSRRLILSQAIKLLT
jgi:hypothetical protein